LHKKSKDSDITLYGGDTMVSDYWIGVDLLPFACEKRQITATFCEIGEGFGDGKV